MTALSQDTHVVRAGADEVDLVALTWGDSIHRLKIVRARRGLDILGDGLGDRRVHLLIDDLDLEGGRVGGD